MTDRTPTVVGILGDGAQARENASYLTPRRPAFHAVTSEFLREGLVDLAHPSADQRATAVLASVGAPGLRRRLVQLWPGDAFATLIAAGALVDPGASLGVGTVVAPAAVVAVGVRIGAHGLVNIGATLSHDVVLGDYVTVSPGAHIGGRTKISDGAWVGIGATVVDGVSLASGAVVGAGAVVIDDVKQANAVVVGNPARLLRIDHEWLSAL